MEIKKSIVFDIYDIAEETLAYLKKCKDVEKRPLNLDLVIEGIFTWLNDRYLPDRMRWASTPDLAVNVWCKSLNIEAHDLSKDSGYHRTVNHLECEFNELFVDILPGRTWKTLFIKRINHTSFVLEIGEDYRIHYYMEHVHNKR